MFQLRPAAALRAGRKPRRKVGGSGRAALARQQIGAQTPQHQACRAVMVFRLVAAFQTPAVLPCRGAAAVFQAPFRASQAFDCPGAFGVSRVITRPRFGGIAFRLPSRRSKSSTAARIICKCSIEEIFLRSSAILCSSSWMRSR